MLGSKSRRGLLSAGILIVAGCAPAWAALDTPFQCTAPDAIYFVGYETGNNEHVFVSTEFAPPRQEEQLEFALRAIPSGSGFRFANDFAEFWGKGHDASLTIRGQDLPCIPTAANVPLDAVLDTPGRSLGGKVRSGPGMDFPQVGSLAEGTRVKIHANAGVHFNGYDWFEIVTGDVRGYQWGGIICSEGRLVPGVFQQCGQ
jgi:membrane-bound inhibitor of C-type lysozyme